MGDITQLYQGVINNSGTIQAGVNTAVSAARIVRNAGTQEGQYRLCTNFVEIQNALGIGGSIGANFPMVTVRNKWSFAERAQSSGNQVVILVNVRRYQEISANTPQLEGGLEYFNYGGSYPTDIQQWVNMYGNEWVSNIFFGGEFWAYYRCVAEGSTTSQNIVDALSANGIVATGSLNGNLNISLQNAQRRASFALQADYYVTGVSSIPQMAPAMFWNYAENFGSVNLDAPEILNFETSSYEVVGVKGVKPGWV